MAKVAERESLYERDFVAWLEEQAAHVRARRFHALDVENVAEELEDMARSRRRALESHIRNVLFHMLKWQYEPRRRSRSWRLSMTNGRIEIAETLDESPSLRPHLNDMISKEYPRARRLAAAETGLKESTFPEACPYTADEILGDRP
jgi:Domain of unknown function DUF29